MTTHLSSLASGTSIFWKPFYLHFFTGYILGYAAEFFIDRIRISGSFCILDYRGQWSIIETDRTLKPFFYPLKKSVNNFIPKYLPAGYAARARTSPTNSNQLQHVASRAVVLGCCSTRGQRTLANRPRAGFQSGGKPWAIKSTRQAAFENGKESSLGDAWQASFGFGSTDSHELFLR